VTSACSFFTKWSTQIEEIMPLHLWWLMAQFLQIMPRLENTLCSSMIVCIPNNLVDDPNWMTFLLTPLVRLRLIGFGWAFDEDKVFEVVKALNSDKSPGRRLLYGFHRGLLGSF
jgi:hypothetical protein